MSNKLAYEQTDVCALCNSTAIVFDSETSEAICSSCGMVVKDNIESMSPEWRSYAGDDIESKSRTGMPSSLAFHDMGLSRSEERRVGKECRCRWLSLH